MSLTAEEWGRIGMLMRDDGRYGAERLFAPGRLAECLGGSAAMPAYGLGWWLNAPLSDAQRGQIPLPIRHHLAAPRPFEPAPPDLFAAIGSHGQRMYVIPSRGLVIVRMARRHEGEPFLDAELLALILG
jgi:CubicO group peptidase (beta-lactamase class C family)